MDRLATSFILGYHGCEEKIAQKLLAGERFRNSENDYDWLGSGIYFWEANPKRALEFIKEKLKREGKKSKPFVVGAVIELGNCLDLMSSIGTEYAKIAYNSLQDTLEKSGEVQPINDGLLHRLDCAVIERLHQIRKSDGQEPLDTIKSVFIEGEEVYSGSRFHSKTHVQICVRNHDCIKGVFRVRQDRF